MARTPESLNYTRAAGVHFFRQLEISLDRLRIEVETKVSQVEVLAVAKSDRHWVVGRREGISSWDSGVSTQP